MQFAHLPGFEISHDWSKGIAALVALMGVALRIPVLRRRLRGDLADESTQSLAIQAAFELIEHTIRVTAFFQGIWQRLGASKTQRTLGSLLNRAWEQIAARSREDGYARGVAHAARYRTRTSVPLGRDFSEPAMVADDTFAFLGYTTGAVLATLNRAQDALARGRLDESASLFNEARIVARQSGSMLNEAKAILGIALSNPDGVEANYTDLANRLQSISSTMDAPDWRRYLTEAARLCGLDAHNST